jgi:hypothetical protein
MDQAKGSCGDARHAFPMVAVPHMNQALSREIIDRSTAYDQDDLNRSKRFSSTSAGSRGSPYGYPTLRQPGSHSSAPLCISLRRCLSNSLGRAQQRGSLNPRPTGEISNI